MFRVEDRHWWYVGLHELILATIVGEKRQPLAILDAGCGTGRLCQLLQPFGLVAGCDGSPEALELSRSRGLERLFHADLNKTDLGENRYDVITSIDVLYHQALANEEQIIGRFFRALKPGGLFLNHGIVSLTEARPKSFGEEIFRRFWKADAFIAYFMSACTSSL